MSDLIFSKSVIISHHINGSWQSWYKYFRGNQLARTLETWAGSGGFQSYPWHQFDKDIKKRKISERASAKMETNHKELLFLNNNTIASSYCFITIIQTGDYPWVLSENRGIKLRDHLRKILEIIAKKGSHQEKRIAVLFCFLVQKRLETEWSRAGRRYNSNLAVLSFIMLMKHELSKRSRVFFSPSQWDFPRKEKIACCYDILLASGKRVFDTYYFHSYAKFKISDTNKGISK